MDSFIFPLKKYKNLSYLEVININDEKYFKYLIRNFKFFYTDIYNFYVYLVEKNKYVDQINEILNLKILLDTETTGFTNHDNVLQLSYIIFNKHDVIKEYNKIVKIDPKIIIKNSFIHNITNKICNDEGIILSDILNDLISDLKICKIMIGHNIKFDLRMLKNEFIRLKLDVLILDTIKLEDTMDLGIKKYGKRIKLSELYKLEFNSEMENAHNAYYDVIATYKLYENLKNQFL
jgi:DNA polymerase III epsilon subunit-like protein